MIKFVKQFISDERGVLTPGAFIFFLAAFGVFGSVLSVMYLTVQKENLLAAAEPAALATIRAIHEGRRGEPIDSIEDAKKFAKAAVVAFSDGTNIDKLMGPSNIPDVSEFADRVIDVKLYPYYGPDYETAMLSAEPGQPVVVDGPSSIVPSSFEEATELADVGLVVIEVHLTEARESSISAGFYNFVSPRKDLRTQSMAVAYVPSCVKTGVYSASEIFVKGDLLAVGPSCIRTDRLWYELQGGAAGSHSFNIRVDGEIKLANRFPTEYQGLMENIPAPSDLLNQIEISAPYEKGLDPDIPKDRIQLRSWRAKELYDFDTIFDEFKNIKVSTFKPNYLNYVNFEDAVYLDKQVRFHAQEPSAEDPEQGINTVDPSMFLTNTTHVLTGCGTAQDQVRMLAGHYDHIVVITNCRLIVSEGATFENVAIFTSAEPTYVEQEALFTDMFGNLSKVVWYPSIRFQAREVGNSDNPCNNDAGEKREGILFWAGRGNIQFEDTLSAYNTQFIMGSLPRKSGKGEEISMEFAISGALDGKNKGEIVNSFRDIVKLRGSSITSIYPTHFYDTLYLEGCLNENVTNRYFRPYFKPVNYVMPIGGASY